jgi:hypothetical protein
MTTTENDDFVIECFTSEDRYGFDFNYSRDFDWECKKVINDKGKIEKYRCVFKNKADFDTAMDITFYNMCYKNMRWKYFVYGARYI